MILAFPVLSGPLTNFYPLKKKQKQKNTNILGENPPIPIYIIECRKQYKVSWKKLNNVEFATACNTCIWKNMCSKNKIEIQSLFYIYNQNLFS